MFPITLESERLLLREFRRDDIPAVIALESAQGNIFGAGKSVATEEGAQRWWKWVEDGQRADPRIEFRFATELRESNELIGIARVCIDWIPTRKGSIGYAFARTHWGKGVGTQAATLVTDFGFTTLKLHRVEATIEPDNLRSQRVAEKLGMKLEGRIRDNFLIEEEWRDALLFAVLEAEWRAR